MSTETAQLLTLVHFDTSRGYQLNCAGSDKWCRAFRAHLILHFNSEQARTSFLLSKSVPRRLYTLALRYAVVSRTLFNHTRCGSTLSGPSRDILCACLNLAKLGRLCPTRNRCIWCRVERLFLSKSVQLVALHSTACDLQARSTNGRRAHLKAVWLRSQRKEQVRRR